MENANESLLDDDLMLDDLDDELAGASREPEEEPQTIASLSDLLAIGKQRGFVTEGEIAQLLANSDADSDRLAEIQQALQAAGIATRDEMITGGAEIDIPFEEEGDFDDLNVEGISVNDTVRMYLREIGRVPLLNARQEILLAQKIEIGEYLESYRTQLAADWRPEQVDVIGAQMYQRLQKNMARCCGCRSAALRDCRATVARSVDSGMPARSFRHPGAHDLRAAPVVRKTAQ
jgi:RNA polymerase primary sigma factor